MNTKKEYLDESVKCFQIMPRINVAVAFYFLIISAMFVVFLIAAAFFLLSNINDATRDLRAIFIAYPFAGVMLLLFVFVLYFKKRKSKWMVSMNGVHICDGLFISWSDVTAVDTSAFGVSLLVKRKTFCLPFVDKSSLLRINQICSELKIKLRTNL